MSILQDPYNRKLSYLRLSVTDLCNFRCNYCLPNGYQGKAKPDELTVDEIATLVSAFSRLGTKKIRLTGGEPTLRKDLPDIIRVCKSTPHIETVALTSNGFHLKKLFPLYQEAGLDKLNISIDSFDPDKFYEITGKRESERIVQALDEIIESGFTSIKVNTLLLKEYFDSSMKDVFDYVRNRPITLRFIELMQTQDNYAFFQKQHISAESVEKKLIEQGWLLSPRGPNAGPAREYYHEDYQGSIGFIAPYSKDFCTSCNRLRVTSQGKVHLCLFGGIAYNIRDFLSQGDDKGLEQYLLSIIREKPEHHFLHEKKVGLIRDLSMIGG
ncbi:GTP 3',8-cyclase MoaA [Basilea psittacipulmonis]|uniref:GTP 3',8-cyclase n=1 Tax=Basilea psittacipulmonis DSM 24701 TaxID=1072685 RepID=A0A077DDW8_9BURK|nr:GTP 3',8-cyclase MoaA [Basilea psittacipulmonis]AIL32819.1 molybdenum cofactor biosynthesis protein MoeA [Basilea psittacipulmonis DSM 24701]